MAELQSVQRVPSGLLNMLGMKGSGRNPTVMSDELRGVFDVRQLYALAVISTGFDGFNTGVAGTTATITVPAQEHWMLLHAIATVRTDGVATTMIMGNLAIDLGGGALLSVASDRLNLGDNSALPDNQVLDIPYLPPYPIMLRGGGRIQAQLRSFIGGAQADVAVQAVFGVFS